jgi:hypothetical protein
MKSWFRRILMVSCIGIAGLAPASRTSAQAARADSAAVLLDAATRFQRTGRADVADAIYRMLIERWGDTAAGAEARRLAGRIQPDGSTRSGRVELQVFSTLYGLWLGVAVPAAFGADSPEPYGVGLLVGGPAGFLTGLGLARSRELTDGQARAITLGGTWGTWQGFGWADVLDLGEQDYSCDFDVCSSNGGTEERFAGMIVGGLAGIATGIVLSRRPISPGVATAVNFGALWGTWFGVAFGVLTDQEGDALLATTLLAGDAGLLSTALLSPGWRMSRNRARLISISGVIGGLAGAGIDLVTQPDGDKALIGIPLAGSVIGLAIGTVTTRHYDTAQEPDGREGVPGLLRLDGGRWTGALSVPALTMVPVRVDGRRRVEARASLTLLSARF